MCSHFILVCFLPLLEYTKASERDSIAARVSSKDTVTGIVDAHHAAAYLRCAIRHVPSFELSTPEHGLQ